MNTDLDLSLPLHAKAYRIAAAYFLSYIPEEYSAEDICMILNDEDDKRRKNILVWMGTEAVSGDDPYLMAADLAEGLAQDILQFAEDTKNP